MSSLSLVLNPCSSETMNSIFNLLKTVGIQSRSLQRADSSKYCLWDATVKPYTSKTPTIWPGQSGIHLL